MASSNCDIKKLQKEFLCQGWNTAGANLLAASCWFAQTIFLYVRPRLAPIDVAIAALLIIFGSLTPGFQWLGAAVGLATGGFYLLWKASMWRPAEVVIQHSLDRKMQRELVGTLADFCKANDIDPEDLDKLVFTLTRKHTCNDQFHQSLIEFFRKRLQMRE